MIILLTFNVIDSLVFQLTVKRLETQSQLMIVDSVEDAALEMISIYHSSLLYPSKCAAGAAKCIFVFDTDLFSNDKTEINAAIK